MFSTLLVIIFLIISPCRLMSGQIINEAFSSFIVDAATSIFLPWTTLNLILCDSKENTVAISKKLSTRGVLNNIFSKKDFENALFENKLHQTVVVLDASCPHSKEILHKANSSKLFIGPIKWMILLNWGILRNDSRHLEFCGEERCIYKELFGNFAIYSDSEVIIAERSDEDYVKILSVYRSSPVRELLVENRGYWTSNDSVQLYDTFAASRRRMNIHQTPLKTCFVMTNPDTVNHLTDYGMKHVDGVTKCNYVWVYLLMELINATLTYTTGNSWGYPDKNGSWNGLTGMLARKEIDIGGTGMYMTVERMGLLHYISLPTPVRQSFIFRQPSLSSVTNLFTLPFQRSVWIAIAMLLSVIYVLLVIFTKIEWKRNVSMQRTNSRSPTLSDNFMSVVGAISQQGLWEKPQSYSARIVILMLLMIALSLSAAYSANIVALLQATTTSITSLKNLLDSPLKVGVHDLVYSRYYSKATTDPVRLAILEQKIEPKGGKPGWMTMEAGIERVRHSLFAFSMEVSAGYQLIQETFKEDEKCGLRDIDHFNIVNPTLAIPLQSPYKELFRVGVLKIQETGLKSRVLSRLFTKRPECSGRTKFVSAGLTECYAAFLALGCGFLVTFGIFLLELVLWRWSNVKPRSSRMEDAW